MRVEPYAVGSFLHVVKRGARGMPITEDEFDRRRFLRLLYYMNDEYLNENWDAVKTRTSFDRPLHWPTRRPLTKVIAFTLMPNHMHLLLQEIREGGASAFMRKLGQSMTNHHNEKYHQSGSLFQGAYRSRTVASDRYLRYVSAYIMVKNVFELYPKGGLSGAERSFDVAWRFATRYQFSSLAHYCGEKSPVIDQNLLDEVFSSTKDFYAFSQDVIASGKWHSSDFE